MPRVDPSIDEEEISEFISRIPIQLGDYLLKESWENATDTQRDEFMKEYGLQKVEE